MALGEAVGRSVGVAVGWLVGRSVVPGVADGVLVGWLVALAVGSRVGSPVGCAVAIGVSSAAGGAVTAGACDIDVPLATCVAGTATGVELHAANSSRAISSNALGLTGNLYLQAAEGPIRFYYTFPMR